MTNTKKYRTRLNNNQSVYNSVNVQEKRWWGWRTVASFVHDDRFGDGFTRAEAFIRKAKARRW